MNKHVRKLMAAVLVLGIGGCSLAPVYQQPDMPVAPAFTDRYLQHLPESATPAGAESISDLGWRQVFTDPVLQRLIDTALKNNRDLRETALVVEAYQAQYRIQSASQVPSLSGDGYYNRQRTLAGSDHSTGETAALQVGVTAYELDFFGRVRNLKDQALEQYLAMEETRKSGTISLVAEVARAYLTWLADRELLRISRDTERVEEESYSLVEQRLGAGIANELDLAQARSSLEAVRVNLAMYRRQVAQDYHYLNQLTGTSLSEAILPEGGLLRQVAPLAVMPAGLPSTILLRRPDIMAAEHELRGANANIGAARAAFFPKVSLTASGGLISSDLSRLFAGDTSAWQFVPAVTVPILQPAGCRRNSMWHVSRKNGMWYDTSGQYRRHFVKCRIP